MAAPRIIDYGRIEPGWRAGILSVQQLADEYRAATGQAVTLTAINKHFKKLGIPRDLSAKIEAKAAAMVSAAMVSGKVSIDGTETLPAEAAMVSAAMVSGKVSVTGTSYRVLRVRRLFSPLNQKCQTLSPAPLRSRYERGESSDRSPTR